MREIKVSRILRERKQRGITIVALVVTIVVLIILATISISALFGDNGIIQKAKETKEKAESSVESEESKMSELVAEYANAMEEPKISTWGYGSYDQETQTVTNGEITLKIGDYVNYDCTPIEGTLGEETTYKSEQAKNGYEDQTFIATDYDYGWRVLGVDDDGQLLLISEDFIQPTSGGYVDSTYNRTYFYLGGTDATGGRNAYVNGVGELNNICAIYGHGVGALEARSVKVEDIDKITGYDPDVGKSGYGGVREYGNEVTFTLTDGIVYYQGTKQPKNLTKGDYSTFTYWTGSEWKTLVNGESATLKCVDYKYYPNTLTGNETNEDGSEPGIATTSVAYKMLFTNSSTGAYPSGKENATDVMYYLANSSIVTDPGAGVFGFKCVYNGTVNCFYVVNSLYHGFLYNRGVRAVVTLSPEVQLQYSGTTKDECALYNMY